MAKSKTVEIIAGLAVTGSNNPEKEALNVMSRALFREVNYWLLRAQPGELVDFFSRYSRGKVFPAPVRWMEDADEDQIGVVMENLVEHLGYQLKRGE